ncbi:MAG: YraN family protein, partial [Rhodospirillales bacterium]|nr:YraN family protein [Rhodospirillales bacterium]
MTAKLRAIKFGAITEHAAAGLLRLKGCRILARQLHSPLGKIDIITRRWRIGRAALAYTTNYPKFAG